MMKYKKIDSNRKQTLIFLELAKAIRGVALIDEIKSHRQYTKYATSLLIKSISDALDEERHLNCMIKYGSDNKLIELQDISARLTVSYENDGLSTGVYSSVITNTNNMSTLEVYRAISDLKSKGISSFDDSKRIRMLQRLPYFFAKWVSKFIFYFRPAVQRDFFRSFTVTSLGKKSLKLCIPISGSTFTFQLGSPKILDADECLFNIVMIYDHRVIDGIQASNLLDKIKTFYSKHLNDLGQTDVFVE